MFYSKCPNCGAEKKFMEKECPECGINYEDFYAKQNLEWNKIKSVKTDKFIDLDINIEQINGYHTVAFVDINDNVVDVKYVKEFEIAEIPRLELSEGYYFESYSIQFYWSDEKYTIQSSKSLDQLAKDSVPLFVWNYANTPILEDMIIHMVPNPIWMDAIQEASKNSYRNNIFDVLERGDLYPKKACGLLFYIYAFSLKVPYSTKEKLFFRAFKCGIQEAEKYVEYDPQYKELYKKIKTTATSYGYSSYRRSGYGNKKSHEANSGSVYGEYLRKDKYEMTDSYYPINRIKYVFHLNISTYSFGSDSKHYLLKMNKTTNQLELLNEKEVVKYSISEEDKEKHFIWNVLYLKSTKYYARKTGSGSTSDYDRKGIYVGGGSSWDEITVTFLLDEPEFEIRWWGNDQIEYYKYLLFKEISNLNQLKNKELNRLSNTILNKIIDRLRELTQIKDSLINDSNSFSTKDKLIIEGQYSFKTDLTQMICDQKKTSVSGPKVTSISDNESLSKNTSNFPSTFDPTQQQKESRSIFDSIKERAMKKIKHKVTWVVNEHIQTEKYNYGEIPKCPLKVDDRIIVDEKIEKVFIGWNPKIKQVDNKANYLAQYVEETREYEITWINKRKITSNKVKYGVMPTYKEKIEKEIIIDAQYKETFTGWDKKIKEVKNNQTYIAQYKRSVRKYQIQFKMKKDTIKVDVSYGDFPKAPKVQNFEEKGNKYVFIGWDKEFEEVKTEAVYKALYTKVNNTDHIVIFKNLNDKIVETRIVKDMEVLNELPKLPWIWDSDFGGENVLFYSNKWLNIPKIIEESGSYHFVKNYPKFLRWDYDKQPINEDTVIQIVPDTKYNRPIIYVDIKGKIIQKTFAILFYFLPLPPKNTLEYNWMTCYHNDTIVLKQVDITKCDEHDMWKVINFSEVTHPITREFTMKLAGVTFNNRQEVIKQLGFSEELVYAREPENEYDKYAILIKTKTGKEVGYIPKEESENLSERLKNGFDYTFSVDYISGGKYRTQGVRVKIIEREVINNRPDIFNIQQQMNQYMKGRISIEELLPILSSVVYNVSPSETNSTVYGLLYYLVALTREKAEHRTSNYGRTYTDLFLSLKSKALEYGEVNPNNTEKLDKQPQATCYSFSIYYKDDNKKVPIDNLYLVPGKPVKIEKSKISKSDEVQAIIDVYSINGKKISSFMSNIANNYLLKGFSYIIKRDEYGFKVHFNLPKYLVNHDISKYTSPPITTPQIRTIKFDSNGGSPIDDEYFVDTIAGKIPIPHKSNFKFDGWYFDEELKNELGWDWHSLNYLIKNKKETTLYAKWEYSPDRESYGDYYFADYSDYDDTDYDDDDYDDDDYDDFSNDYEGSESDYNERDGYDDKWGYYNIHGEFPDWDDED